MLKHFRIKKWFIWWEKNESRVNFKKMVNSWIFYFSLDSGRRIGLRKFYVERPKFYKSIYSKRLVKTKYVWRKKRISHVYYNYKLIKFLKKYSRSKLLKHPKFRVWYFKKCKYYLTRKIIILYDKIFFNYVFLVIKRRKTFFKFYKLRVFLYFLWILKYLIIQEWVEDQLENILRIIIKNNILKIRK